MVSELRPLEPTTFGFDYDPAGLNDFINGPSIKWGEQAIFYCFLTIQVVYKDIYRWERSLNGSLSSSSQ